MSSLEQAPLLLSPKCFKGGSKVFHFDKAGVECIGVLVLESGFLVLESAFLLLELRFLVPESGQVGSQTGWFLNRCDLEA